MYDFVEIMACPGGCVSGGGQPFAFGTEPAAQRASVLYGLDEGSHVRFSHENRSIAKIYEEFLGKPMSHKSHALLHVDHSDSDTVK